MAFAAAAAAAAGAGAGAGAGVAQQPELPEPPSFSASSSISTSSSISRARHQRRPRRRSRRSRSRGLVLAAGAANRQPLAADTGEKPGEKRWRNGAKKRPRKWRITAAGEWEGNGLDWGGRTKPTEPPLQPEPRCWLLEPLPAAAAAAAGTTACAHHLRPPSRHAHGSGPAAPSGRSDANATA